jgi:20S proteasome alpha/beta subunit
MTTIVGDWRRKILVADSQFTDTDTNTKYFEDKVYEVPNGWFGCAGHHSDSEKVLAYLRTKGKTKPKLKNTDNSFILLTPDGLFTCDDGDDWESVRTFMAIGSGAHAAEAILRSGGTAEEAVYWACNVDLMSHEPIKVYSLNSKEPTIWTFNEKQ